MDVYNLQVPEPSGLTLNTTNTALYTVSDPPNIVSASTYSSVGRFNDRNVNQMFLHRMVSAGEKTELFRVTRLASNSFSWEQLTFNSDEHQWRANSISSGPYHVYWINARSYLDMKHFDQDIIIGKF